MHVFISYAKKDTRALAERLFRELDAIEGMSAWMDQSLKPASSWARQIEREIDRADYVIVLISPDVSRPETSEQSHSFVLNEIQRALESNPRKPILPVLAQRSPIPVEIQTIQRIDATRDEDAAVAEIIAHICVQAGIPTPAERARIEAAREVERQEQIEFEREAERQRLETDIERKRQTAARAREARRKSYLAVLSEQNTQRPLKVPVLAQPSCPLPPPPTVLAEESVQPSVSTAPRKTIQRITALSVVAMLGIALFTLVRTQLQSRQLPDLLISNVQMIEPPFVDSPILINVTVTNGGEQKLSSINVVGNFGGLQGSRGQIIEEIEPAQSLTLQFAEFYSEAGEYQGSITIDNDNRITESNENNNSYTINFSIQDQPIFIPTMSITEIATLNISDWQPQTQTFSGIDMMRVPAGCFMMGSNDGDAVEQPVHEQCVGEFWIGRTEVTNGQYGSSDNFSNANHPRKNVTWFEARDFCASKGLRLPTEAEWEYAARGSQNWIYPWGDTFVAENVVYSGNSNGSIADVGSLPSGASWVGALDMAGNVWEWVSSVYEAYPYVADDGREDLVRTDVWRVLRGGSGILSSPDNFRAVSRYWYNPHFGFGGFRCALS